MIRYIVCTTPRTRSTLLQKMIGCSKNIGRDPIEYLPMQHKSFKSFLSKQCPPDAPIAGFKIMYKFFKEVESCIGINSFRYIYLYRKNKIRQAISLVKAIESDNFAQVDATIDDTALYRLPQDYIFEQIDRKLSKIQQWDTAWQEFFSASHSETLRICYEDMETLSGQLDTLLNLYTFLGVSQTPSPHYKDHDLKSQSSQWNDAIYTAYLQQQK